MTAKNFIRILVVVAIIGAVIYLQSGKSKPVLTNALSNPEIPSSVAIDNSTKFAETSTVPISTSTPVFPKSKTTKKNPLLTAVLPPAPAPAPAAADRVATKEQLFPRVKEIVLPSGFINTTNNFRLAPIVGKKVILVDFWTYSCINCIRTQPYLNAWYEKYKSAGLEIVGMHTPEFDFEKIYDNVKAAVTRDHINYPVVLDNDQGTWSAYGNRFWPRRYLIDIDGYIVLDQIGEGGYEDLEIAIQKALAERASVLRVAQAIPTGVVHPQMGSDAQTGEVISPETYFGASRNRFLANGAIGVEGDAAFTATSSGAQLNKFSLDGTWHFAPEYAENRSAPARLIYRYRAKNVYFVASAATSTRITILRDGVPLSVALAGEDVQMKKGAASATIKDNRLYKLIKEGDTSEHTLEINIPTPGLRAFTFTFG